jgi:L-amino acid N-acyltransferase YncA
VASDADALIRIYNESVAGGGHSPTLANGTVQEMRAIIALSRRKGWPVWVMTAPGATDGADPDAPRTVEDARVPIAWAHMRAIVWAPDACRTVGDLWLYVDQAWHGSGIAMRMIRGVFKECRRYGFDTVTCWILGSNRRSLSLVRACRLERWALMPAVVDYGGLRFDLEVWGCRLDDPVWLAHMTRLERRHASLERVREGRRAVAAVAAVPALDPASAVASGEAPAARPVAQPALV